VHDKGDVENSPSVPHGGTRRLSVAADDALWKGDTTTDKLGKKEDSSGDEMSPATTARCRSDAPRSVPVVMLHWTSP